MNGIEKITARIEADAREEAAAIRREAERKSAALRAEFDAEAQNAYQKLIRDGVKATEQRVERLLRAAEMDSKKEILSVKQEMVSKAFVLALKKIADLPEDEYAGFFGKLAAEASRSGAEEIIFNEADASGRGKKVVKAANDHLKDKGMHGKLTMSAEKRGITGGFILKDGDIEVNCAAETLTESVRSEMAARVAEVMFGA